MLHGYLMAIIAFLKQKSLIDWASFDKDSDEVATEQLIPVVDVQVDVTFMPHDDPDIS